ncbi:NUDIX hydrolase [Roseibium sediminis]|uniref:NUDIX hydrolase n=1 Tax=Roseibium sediminis TaxID=1775174 RepID=UPI00123D4888|nr:NUDIX hydrolase [Roseibium sediminis]
MDAPLQERLTDDWLLLENEKVFEIKNRVRVNRHKVWLPDNRVIDDYYHIDLPSFVTIYAVNEQGEVLLLEQYKHGVGEVCLTLPGGQIDPGEEPEFAARRELLEETGYGGGRWLSGPSLVLHGNQRISVAHTFVACHVIKLNEANSGDLEQASLVTRPRSELWKTIMDGQLPITTHVAVAGIAETLLAGL